MSRVTEYAGAALASAFRFVLCRRTPFPPPPGLTDGGDLGRIVFRGLRYLAPSLEGIDGLCKDLFAPADGHVFDDASTRAVADIISAGTAVAGRDGLGLVPSGSVGFRMSLTSKLLEA